MLCCLPLSMILGPAEFSHNLDLFLRGSPGLDGARLVIDPGLLAELAILIENGELRRATIDVATNSKRNRCTSFTCLVSRHEFGGR